MTNIHKLKVDLKVKQTSVVPVLVQFDAARLEFQVFDKGQPFDFTGYDSVEFAHKRPDGEIVVGKGSIKVEGTGVLKKYTIIYDYKGNEMSKIGNVETSFSVYSGEKKVSIQAFRVKIVEDIGGMNDGIGLEDKNVLQELIANLDALNVDELKARVAKAEIVASATPPTGVTEFWIDTND